MKIFQILNVADLAFMAAGLSAALLMITVGARHDRRANEAEETKAAQMGSARCD